MSFTNKLEIVKVILLVIIAIALVALSVLWFILFLTEKDKLGDPFQTLNRPQETRYVIPTKTK